MYCWVCVCESERMYSWGEWGRTSIGFVLGGGGLRMDSYVLGSNGGGQMGFFLGGECGQVYIWRRGWTGTFLEVAT